MSSPNVYVPDGFGSSADHSYRYAEQAAHALKPAIRKTTAEKIALGAMFTLIAITWLAALALAAGYFAGCKL